MKETKFPKYFATEDGRIISHKYKTPRELKPSPNTYGYLHVSISNNKKITTETIHKLVAETYLGACPEGYTVNHKDGKKLNNHYTNFEYITTGDNTRHAHAMNLVSVAKGEDSHRSKLKDRECLDIIRKHRAGILPHIIAKEYSTPVPTIKSIVYGQSRKYLAEML